MKENLSKTLFLTLEYPPARGGVSRYYGEIVSRWPGAIEVVSEKSQLFWWLWPKWLPLLWRMSRRIKKEGVEMVWVGQVLPLGYAALWLKKRYKVPYAVFTHGMDILLPQASWWKNRWLKRILRQAAIVVANSEFTKNELLKLGVPDDKIVIVYPCVSRSLKPEAQTSEQKDGKIILSVGRLVKRKGFDKVIKIMPRLLKRIPDLKYVIVGNGPELQNLELSRRERDPAVAGEIGNCPPKADAPLAQKLQNTVSILTDVSDSELIQQYERSNVFVMPCEQLGGDVEGFGMVFLEAASYGLPVVVGRSGGALETVHHGYGGFVIDPNSEDELYQALLKILTDSDFAARMGKYGQEWVRRNFIWEKEITKLKERLTRLIR